MHVRTRTGLQTRMSVDKEPGYSAEHLHYRSERTFPGRQTSDLLHPPPPGGLRVRREDAWRKLQVARAGQQDLEGPGPRSFAPRHDGQAAAREVRVRVVHELPLLFGAEVDEAAVLREPHLALEPVVRLPRVAVGLALPEPRLEGGRELLGAQANLLSSVVHTKPELVEVLGHLWPQLDAPHDVRLQRLVSQDPCGVVLLRLTGEDVLVIPLLLLLVLRPCLNHEGRLTNSIGVLRQHRR
mmetsp:Transcript_78866/g.243324  ORF Transcript_78866/g.243324 Transcript_78866/m.243324 type:complete len:240 (-) Transcript_78866:1461-2180(-)